jgi:hypothetical protein
LRGSSIRWNALFDVDGRSPASIPQVIGAEREFSLSVKPVRQMKRDSSSVLAGSPPRISISDTFVH